ncbi:hypothetical protein SAMN06269185_2141 [Natronoarchaeum philippinense]|uniref:Uncharacterized protein n=1 Tax=Natronoarchaeum philippinense TaxID=558529 RepID=A0A285NVA3_NATPI|nr:hypothetical protein [Natronoarchaeum philippinense]SNZ13369.1 hypothetical protein SAMN06269185_2141 [Natronoarchaeum philippinense]
MIGQHFRMDELGGDERGQTVQDFAVGISIFLLVVGAVFLLYPSLFTPYEQAIADESPDSQADRIAMLVADNVSGDEATNELTDEEMSYWLDADADALREAVGVSSSTHVNMTVTTLGTDEETPIEYDGAAAAAGPDAVGQDASVAARIVTTNDDECEPACRLVVRVW